jgi:hypothetical protein
MSTPGRSWCDPAGASPAQVRSSVRLVASVAQVHRRRWLRSVHSDFMGCGIEPRKVRHCRGRGFSFARRQHVRHRHARCCRPAGVKGAERSLCRQTPEVGAVCGKAARTVLCGGRAMKRTSLPLLRRGDPLFDHLVRDRKQLGRHLDAECSRGFQVDHEFELGRLHHRQVGRLLALENAAGVEAGLAKLDDSLQHCEAHRNAGRPTCLPRR